MSSLTTDVRHSSLKSLLLLLGLGAAMVLVGFVVESLLFARLSINQAASDAIVYKIKRTLESHAASTAAVPASVMSVGGNNHSWRALLALRFAADNGFSFGYSLQQEWNSPTNSLVSLSPPIPFDPNSEPATKNPTTTRFVVVPGAELAVSKEDATPISEMSDGRENTIVVIEVTETDIIWTEPRDIELSELRRTYDSDHGPLNAGHPDGPALIFADFHVYRMKRKLPFKHFLALLTKSGGEDVTRGSLVSQGYLVQAIP